MSIKELAAINAPPTKQLGKRLFDLLFSGCALLFGSPLYLLLIFLVKATSKGPAFFKGLRMGQNGKLIYCWKFRTMYLGADKKLEELLEKDPQMRYEWETFHKLKSDPRITKIGQFMRSTSLDEIPQFWNVFRGDLSIVGPRPIEVRYPERALDEIRERYGARTEKILSVKPGITCIWQTCGRNELTFDERAKLEEAYVDTQSFWLDLKLIAKTFWVLLFSPKGAY